MEIPFRAALMAWLRADPILADMLNSIEEDGPVAASPPHLALVASAGIDWSTKTARGRELRLGVMVEAPEAKALPDLADAAEAAILALPPDLPGWRIASCVYLRSLASDEGKQRRRLIEFRVRMLEG